MDVFWDKMFDASTAFDHPVVMPMVIVVAAVLAITPIMIEIASRVRHLAPEARRELYLRYRSWLVLIPLMVGPVLLGAGAAIIAVGVLSILCYAEFARATGMFRWRSISAVVALAILMFTFASMDQWYALFAALPSLAFVVIAVVAMLRDQPNGYLQRVALGVLAVLLFGQCLGHLGYMANDRNFRPMILAIFLCVEMSDILAFIGGRLFGHRRMAPRTSPNKTWGGSITALVLTTILFAVLGRFVFDGQPVGTFVHLLAMGVLLSVTAQFGDLVVSSIKRDLGMKDMGAVLPGHGGLLDRFDSVLLVAPAIFHYVGYFQGIGLEDTATRIFTGGLP